MGDADAIVVGAGPNGLAASIELARAGRSVLLLEAADTVGGGCRTAELTLPGFRHDVCSAIHPLAVASPFFRSISQEELGVGWVHPGVPLAHPLDGGEAVVLERSVEATAAGLGADRGAYLRAIAPLVDAGERLVPQLLAPLRMPRHPVSLARFGLSGIRSATGLSRSRFRGERARALLAGVAAHSILPLDRSPTAAFGLTLALLAHLVGWPMARGGSQAIADGLARHLESLGGRIETGRRITALSELPPDRTILLDVTPRQLVSMAQGGLPGRYERALRRYRYGPGVYKVDWALSSPIPWTAPRVPEAGTVHLGGSLEEVADAEAAVWRGEHPERPFVVLAQQSPFDPSRAPAGRHTAWAYCHVPNGSSVDMAARIEAQVERFAPGFGDVILARSTMGPSALERHDPNHVGGDINGGIQDLRQLFTRPVVRTDPYSTPVPGLFLCSSSTPPGGGVHGMCGSFAARSAVRHRG